MKLLFCLLISFVFSEYQPSWESLESRPPPKWFDEAKLGIFCHWGVSSVPAYKESFWWQWKGEKPAEDVAEYVKNVFGPDATYADFANKFTAELFDAKEFADVVASSGAKYFVFTSKQADGYAMWPSKYSWNWNSMDVGPRRDIVGELRSVFGKTDIHFGLSFSLLEWFHPLYLKDSKENSTEFVENVSYPEMLEIVNDYKPDIFWSEADSKWPESHWKSLEFIAWLYNKSPVKETVVVNDRWGGNSIGHFDKQSWGFRQNLKLDELRSVHDLIVQLARTISCGGNLLLNIGPDKHGRIPVIFQQRIKDFVTTVSEAVHRTLPWEYQNDTGNIWYTSRYRNETQEGKLFLRHNEAETIVYAWVLDVTGEDILLPYVKPTP